VKNNNSDAIRVNTGFWYSIDELGNGIYPIQADEITILYTIKWIKDSTSMEADLDKIGYSKSTTVLLSSAISGLQQGLMLFPMGSSGRLYLPSGLAFGMSGHDKTAKDTSDVFIPANANLLYEIKLIDVKSTKFASDTTAIGTYLQTNTMKALKDESGIRYTIDHVDTANHSNLLPHLLDSVLVTYTEQILKADTLVTSVSTPTKVALADQVTCWRIMLPKHYKEGSTITMYSPSGYAYGSSTTSATGAIIPINSNMVYRVTLIKIIPH